MRRGLHVSLLLIGLFFVAGVVAAKEAKANVGLHTQDGDLSIAVTSKAQEIAAGKPVTTEKKSNAQAFGAAFAVIVMSEIGDKTFLIAALMSMKHPRMQIFLAASSALVIMTVLSAALGFVVPNLIPRKYTQYMAALLFLFFGVKMLKDGWEMDPNEGQKEMAEVEEELAERDSKKVDVAMEEGDVRSPAADDDSVGLLKSAENLAHFLFTPVFVQTFVMTFLAEWGDRSQIATIALAAAENVYMVTLGASIAHCLCTGAAIIGGKMLASKISVRTVTLIGAVLFIVFAITSFVFAGEEASK